MLRWGWLAALLAIVIFVAGCSCSRSDADAVVEPASVVTPEQQSVESAKSSVELIQAKDYAASYRVLSATDQEKVTEEEWTRRCQEVEAIAGLVETYRVTGSRWLDEGHTIRAVDVEIEFSKLDEPITSTLFYEIKDGKAVQTMLWGRELRLAGDEQ